MINILSQFQQNSSITSKDIVLSTHGENEKMKNSRDVLDSDMHFKPYYFFWHFRHVTSSSLFVNFIRICFTQQKKEPGQVTWNGVVSKNQNITKINKPHPKI